MLPTRSQFAWRTLAMIIAFVALTGGLSGCGDDDEDAVAAPPSTAAAPDTAATADPQPEPTSAPNPTAAPVAAAGDEEYCRRAAALNDQTAPPTMEQIQEYAAVAPDAVREPLGIVLELLEESDGNFVALFASPEGGAALEELLALEAEICGFEPPSDASEQQDPSVTVVDPDATQVAVEATDHHFEFDAPTEAGRYSFTMANAGAEAHILILVHLEEGATLDEVLAAEGEEGAVAVYESEVAPPGAEAVLTADLEPGDWVLLCPIPDASGAPHFAIGMIEEFTIG